jgi:iron(III) transport system ATP-binding protein
MTPAIALSDVSFKYGERAILSGFGLSVAPGEVVALLGPSGSGKSTVVRLILGLAAPANGSVYLGPELASQDGKIIVPPEERRLAVVFQDLALWPHLTVHGNLAFGLTSRGLPRTERDTRIKDVLARVGLAGRERAYPGELSGGERQRVAIARATVLEPHAILLDEPLSNLDGSLFKERASTVLYVTHDLREAVALGDRIAIIESGKVVQEGSLEALRAQPASAFVQSLLADLDWTGAAGA